MSTTFDCLIHPFPASNAEFGEYLEQPLRGRMKSLGSIFNRGLVTPTFPEYLPDAVPEDGIAGSSLKLLKQHMADSEIDTGVLVPLTRGLMPDVRKTAMIASATNAWLAAAWLGQDTDADGRLFGTIRVPSRHPSAAVAEIEKWAGDERFVQVAVPLEAVAPYGQEQYLPIWEAAAHFRLPVMVVTDRARGIGYPLTPLGNPPSYMEAACQVPVSAALHIASLITEGVFERLPNLQFIFGDGAFDALTLLHWRVTNDWRAGRVETPWATRAPIDYLVEHIRFVLHPDDGPMERERFMALVDLADAGDRLLFGSRWPYWDTHSPRNLAEFVDEELKDRVLTANPSALYAPRLEARVLR